MAKPKKGTLKVFGNASHNVTIYIAIGQLIVHWANNESLFMRILHSLMGGGDHMKDATTIFHSHKNTMGRLDLIQALGNGKISDELLKEELSRLIRSFRALSRLRNFIAHSTYNYGSELQIVDALGVVFDNQKGAFRTEVKRFDLATINEIDNACLNAVTMNRELWTFALALDRHFGREPEMPQQVPPELLDELAMRQSPPTTPKAE